MHNTRVLGAIALAVGLAVGALGGVAAFAQGAKEDARIEVNARLSIAQVFEKVTAQGYRDIDGIEREKDVFEVDARTGAGERVRLYVDARSGEILQTKSQARDSMRPGKDADRAQALPRETVGWYLSDIYGRMKAAGI
ncbi:MAG: PepSY domain-containing protein [Burkholderiales bacterium]|nr:PepSY domain-containing protein [Burkholderiales bacterium]